MEHTYFCKFCGEEFTTDEETHFKDVDSGVTFPNETWPYCSTDCRNSDGMLNHSLAPVLDEGDQ